MDKNKPHTLRNTALLLGSLCLIVLLAGGLMFFQARQFWNSFDDMMRSSSGTPSPADLVATLSTSLRERTDQDTLSEQDEQLGILVCNALMSTSSFTFKTLQQHPDGGWGIVVSSDHDSYLVPVAYEGFGWKFNAGKVIRTQP